MVTEAAPPASAEPEPEPEAPSGPSGLVSKVWNAFDGLAGDTMWSGAHDALQLVTALTSFYLLQRGLGLESYGAYVSFYGLLGAFGAMCYSGVGLALLQRLMGEGDEPSTSLRSFLSLTLLAGSVGSVIAILLGAFTLTLTWAEVTIIVMAEIMTVAVIFLSSTAVQAVSGFAAAVRVKGAVIPMRLGVLLSLYATDSLTIRNLGTGFLLCFTLYCVYLLLYHLPKHGYRVSFGVPSEEARRSSLMFSAPMGASKLQTDGDKYLLGAFRHTTDAGLYGAAYRMVLLGTLPLLALDTAAFQRFLPKGEGIPGLHLRRSVLLASLMGGASLFVAAGLYVMLPFLDFLFDEEFKQAADIVPWLLILIPLIATSSTPLNGLLGLGLADKRMWVYISSAVVSLFLYAVLIPPFGWEGALVATIISEIYLSIAGWAALWYHQRLADAELSIRKALGSDWQPDQSFATITGPL
ncbi:MAG: lipopolysaccharide biosynthesis protein [Actinomycetota bacterium]